MTDMDGRPAAEGPVLAGREADSVAATVSQVGDRWTFLLLREAFFGVRRFVDFQRNLGVARNLLSARLGDLVANGILERRQYSTRPPRDEYRLTEKGRDLYGVTVALMRWGDRWLTDSPPLRLTHAEDGGEIEQELRCTTCGRVIGPRDVHYEHMVAGARRSTTALS
jgi:DNA-binding HxlR family transcriptional regulator